MRTVTPAQRDALIEAYFTPHAAAMEALVSSTVDTHGRAVIVDVHSYPTAPSGFEDPGVMVEIRRDVYRPNGRPDEAAMELLAGLLAELTTISAEIPTINVGDDPRPSRD